MLVTDGSEQQARWSNKLAEDGSEHKQDGRDRERKRATLLTHSELEKNKTASLKMEANNKQDGATSSLKMEANNKLAEDGSKLTSESDL